MRNNIIKPSILSIKDFKFSGPDDPEPPTHGFSVRNRGFVSTYVQRTNER